MTPSKIVGSGQWVVGSEEIKTAHYPLPTAHFDRFAGGSLQRIVFAPMVPVSLQRFVNLASIDPIDLTRDFAMQSLEGWFGRGQVASVGFDNLPFGLRGDVGDIVKSALIVMQHVEPARDLISRGVAEPLGQLCGQFAVTITDPFDLVPISLLDLE